MVLIWLVGCPVFAQPPLKPLTPADYGLWGTHAFDAVSDKGAWVSDVMHYDKGPDTLAVRDSHGKKTYKIVGGYEGAFGGESRFACRTHTGIAMLELTGGFRTDIPAATAFAFSKDGQWLLTLEGSKSKNLVLRDAKGTVVKSIGSVTAWKLNPAKTHVAYVVNGSDGQKAALLKLGGKGETLLMAIATGRAFEQFTWQENGKSLVFIQQPEGSAAGGVYHYALKQKKLYRFDPETIEAFPKDMELLRGYWQNLKISPDGQRVFIALARKNPCIKYHKDSLQIWNGNDAILYPKRRMNCDFETQPKTAVWWPRENRMLQITDDHQPLGWLDGTRQYAVTANPAEISEPYEMNQKADLYLTQLETGKRWLWLPGQSLENKATSFDPLHPRAAFFKDDKWWLYDFAAKSTRCLTGGLELATHDPESHGHMPLYGVAGWSPDGKSLFLYDTYDLWQLQCDGSGSKRLTGGSQDKTVYRLVQTAAYQTNINGRYGAIVDAGKDLLLSANSQNMEGFYLYSSKKGLRRIISDSDHKYEVVKAPEAAAWYYKSENFGQPPVVNYFTAADKKTVAIAHTNTHHKKFQWGKAEMIQYKNADGVGLRGVLCYPVPYDASKKYPMVVRIYEKESDMGMRYHNPTMLTEIGFNIPHLTSQGYFVLLPDIVYKQGEVGLSATDCVVAATNEVIRRGVVDPDKIGLNGNSFSGYETNFIITQTNLFRAAMSGAGVADLKGWYLSMGWPTGMPEIYRFEQGQWRMGASPFEDPEAYRKNSPSEYVQNVHTPLLLWTGERDYHVHYYQSVAYYLALRRLHKEQMFLIYPNEEHTMINEKNQQDLTLRMDDWFGYYLKGEKPKAWIANGIW